MAQPLIDVGRLAALLDGRLDAQERTELLARLADAGDDYEVFAETAAILQAVGQPVPREVGQPLFLAANAASTPPVEPDAPSGSVPGVAPLSPRPAARGARPRVHWLALAAVLAGVALAPVLWSRLRPPTPGDPGRLAALLDSREQGLPPEWLKQRSWSKVRTREEALTPEARAARLGTLLVDLEIAVDTRDSAATAQLAAWIEELLSPLPGAGPVADGYAAIRGRAGQPPGQLRPLLEQGRGGVAAVPGADFVGLGAWTEAALLAAARHDADFFRSRETRAALDPAARMEALPADDRQTIEQIRTLLRADGGLDWRALETRLRELQGSMGTPRVEE